MLVLAAASAGLAVLRLRGFAGTVSVMTQARMEKVGLATEWSDLVRLNGARTLAVLKRRDPGMKGLMGPGLEQTTQRISWIQARVEQLPRTADEQVMLTRVAGFRETYRASRAKALKPEQDHASHAFGELVDGEVMPAMQPMRTASRTRRPTTSRA